MHPREGWTEDRRAGGLSRRGFLKQGAAAGLLAAGAGSLLPGCSSGGTTATTSGAKATPWQVTYRVLWPLLSPAIFAGAVLVFSGVIDDFVLVDLLSSNSSNTPMSVYIYSQQRGGNGGPALNALGTIMLAMSFVIAIVGYLGYLFLTRGERGSGIDALTTIAGEG